MTFISSSALPAGAAHHCWISGTISAYPFTPVLPLFAMPKSGAGRGSALPAPPGILGWSATRSQLHLHWTARAPRPIPRRNGPWS